MAGIYLDNNASTPLLPEAWDAMRPCFLDRPGNPASSHHAGRYARQALEDARDRIAALLDADPADVLFTSGATEANNLALLGLVDPTPGTIVTSPLEHPCVAEPIRQLTSHRHEALPVTPTGIVDVEHAAFPDDVRLVSVMLANHETGAIQPIEALAEKLAGQAPFHCDAAAAVGKIPISFRRLGVTALTVSAHKFHGPKGVGALVVRKGAKLRPLLWGGHQQHGKRPGTEPVPLAVGMAAALAWCVRHLDENRRKVENLRRQFLAIPRETAGPVVLNGPETGGLPHTVNLSFPGCRADALMMALDLAGVACSTGSACSSGSLLPSPILAAMGVPPEVLHSALRFSFSPLLGESEVADAAWRIAKAVNQLRQAAGDPE